jgi:hypothetical protein
VSVFILLCFVLIEKLILVYWVCYVCRSRVDYSIEGNERQSLVNQVLGNLVRLHHPGVVTLPGNGHRELTTTWEHYWFTPDGSYRTAQEAVVHNFSVSIFSMYYFFFITPSALMCFLLHILFYSYIFGCPRRVTTRRTHLRSSMPLLKRSSWMLFCMLAFKQTMHTTRKSSARKWTRTWVLTKFTWPSCNTAR